MAEIPESLRATVVYSEPDMEQVPVQTDLIYRQIGNQALRMDVYQPLDSTPGERRPAVLFVHGHAPPELLPSVKELGQYTSWGRLVAVHGLVGVTFNHRSAIASTQMAEALDDVQAAIDYVREQAALLGVDPDRLCLWVCSAGGLKLKLALQANPAFIRCTVAYYPVVDLASLGDEDPFSVTRYLSPQAAPMLLVRAGLDHPPFNAGIDRFVQGALGQNVPLELYNHATGDHVFDVRNDDETSRVIIARTLAFMRRHLLGEA